MNTPTPEQIAKLPKWTQSYIATLEREHAAILSKFRDMLDNQTPSSISREKMMHINGCTAFITQFVQAEDITFKHAGVELSVRLHKKDCIDLDWGPDGCHGMGDLCFIPTSYQQARITNMAYTPHEYQRLVNGQKRKNQREQEKE